MIDRNPYLGCTERYTACHDHCERRAKWLEMYHGEQKHLAEMKSRWERPWSAAREKTTREYLKSGVVIHKKGGNQ